MNPTTQEHPARQYALGFIDSARKRGYLRDWDMHLLQHHAPTIGATAGEALPTFIQRTLPSLLDQEGTEKLSNEDLFAAAFTLLLLDSLGFRKPAVSQVENDIILH